MEEGNIIIISDFLQSIELITDHAISDKEKLKMIEAEIKNEYNRLGVTKGENPDIKKNGEITYKVMLRQSSTTRDGKGNVIIPERDLLEWFGKGLHLMKYSEWDTI